MPNLHSEIKVWPQATLRSKKIGRLRVSRRCTAFSF